MAKTEKRIYPPSVKVYFTGEDAVLYRKIERLVKKYGFSASTIGLMAVRQGLPFVHKGLKNFEFDAKFQAEWNGKHESVFVQE